MLLARISMTFSGHFSLSFIASGRSKGLHPVSSHSCSMYVRAGHPAFARPYVGVHGSTSHEYIYASIYIYIYIYICVCVCVCVCVCMCVRVWFWFKHYSLFNPVYTRMLNRICKKHIFDNVLK